MNRHREFSPLRIQEQCNHRNCDPPLRAAEAALVQGEKNREIPIRENMERQSYPTRGAGKANIASIIFLTLLEN
jgi:hypothetical protein